jgi:hypothetical protein
MRPTYPDVVARVRRLIQLGRSPAAAQAQVWVEVRAAIAQLEERARGGGGS